MKKSEMLKKWSDIGIDTNKIIFTLAELEKMAKAARCDLLTVMYVLRNR